MLCRTPDSNMHYGRWIGWLAKTLAPEDIPPTSAPGDRARKMPTFTCADAATSSSRATFVRRIIAENWIWSGGNSDVLCFIEVKTRTTRDVKPAEAAVDRDKQRDLSLVARDFLRHMPQFVPVTFRRLSVYYDHGRPTALPSNCFKMRFRCRTIVKTWIRTPLLKGFSKCLN